MGALLPIELGSPARAASFTGLGDLPGLVPVDPNDGGGTEEIFFSTAQDVSDDVDGNGPAVVGNSVGAGNEAFRWSRGQGMMGLGTLQGGGFSEAHGVSRDGSVVTGYSGNDQRRVQAFRWTSTGGMIGLGDPSVDSSSYGISADGDSVVGFVGPQGNYRQPGTSGEAFRWTAASGMVGLGELPGGDSVSYAWDATADGSVIVGESMSTRGYEPFLWTASQGMVGLGGLPGGDLVWGAAYGISADGSIVVGQSFGPNGNEAFRWTALGGMMGLGNLPGGGLGSRANGVTSDGSVIVGSGPSERGVEAFIWDQSHGMRPLLDVLRSEHGLDLGGWTLEQATAISDDGLSIVGYGQNPNGYTEAWLVTGIPEPSTALLLALGLLGVGAGRYHRSRTQRGGCRHVEERDRDRHRGGGVCQLRSGSSSIGR